MEFEKLCFKKVKEIIIKVYFVCYFFFDLVCYLGDMKIFGFLDFF